jgi:hypothetical protein
MIKSELDFVWITTDGKKFLNKRDAEDRQKQLKILEEDENVEDLVEYEKFLEDEWELTDNGNYGIVGSHFNNLPQFQLSPEEYKIVKKEQEKRKSKLKGE